MKQFVTEEAGTVTVDWVVLTGGAVALALAAMGLVWSGGEDLSGDIALALSDDSVLQTAGFAAANQFDLSGYAFLTGSGGTPGWQAAVDGFHSAADFYGWLQSDNEGARDARNSDHIRAMFSDDYATTFAAAQALSIDLSSFESPNALRAFLAEELGL